VPEAFGGLVAGKDDRAELSHGLGRALPGAGTFAQVNPLQRIWRDSAVAARHAVTLPMVNFEVYGKALLGRQDQITLLI
jgi:hypothetical protein